MITIKNKRWMENNFLTITINNMTMEAHLDDEELYELGQSLFSDIYNALPRDLDVKLFREFFKDEIEELIKESKETEEVSA